MPIYELIRIYYSDASVGAPTKASGMDTINEDYSVFCWTLEYSMLNMQINKNG